MQLAGLVHDGPVDADGHLGHEREVRVHVDRLAEHLGRAGLDAGEPLVEGISPISMRCQSWVTDSRPTAAAASSPVGVAPSLDADVALVAEEELEHRARRVAHVGLELPDAAEQRAREDAAVVEDHCLDHAGGYRLPRRHPRPRVRARVGERSG